MSILVRGTKGFAQAGQERWQTNGWDLDRLVVPMQGERAALAAYIAGLSMWSGSGIDGNMFLADWVIDEDKVHPTVDLIYIGKKGGSLPPTKTESGSVLQNISYGVEITDVASFQIDVQYLAPVATYIEINRGGSAATGSDPADTRQIVYWTTGALSSVNPGGVTQTVINDLIDRIFGDLVLEEPRVEELVPSEYYRSILTKKLIWTR